VGSLSWNGVGERSLRPGPCQVRAGKEEAYDGSIEAASGAGEGSRFTVLLPAA